MRIRHYRKLQNITQEELAKAVGVTQGYICTLENGSRENPSLQVLMRIAGVLKVDLNDLIRKENEIEERTLE